MKILSGMITALKEFAALIKIRSSKVALPARIQMKLINSERAFSCKESGRFRFAILIKNFLMVFHVNMQRFTWLS